MAPDLSRALEPSMALARRFLLAACGFALAAPVLARPLDAVTASGEIRVALYGDNAPFSAEENGRPHGIDVDIAKAIADQLKLRLDLRLVDAGENVDGDFRLNLWKGDLAGTPLADVMLHVPNDRMLALRTEQIFLTAPYFDQHLVFAYRRAKLAGLETVADLADHPIAVEGASASDMLLLMAENGRFRNNLKHFKSFDEAAKAYLSGEVPVLAGTRAAVEAALFAGKAAPDENPIAELAVPGMVKTSWELGGAVRTDSRDLAYAVGDALTALSASGRLKAICAAYGVTYVAPKGY